MITIDIPERELADLEKAIKETSRSLTREVTIAINATVKKTQSAMAKEVGKELAVPQRAIKKRIKITGRAKKSILRGSVTLSKEDRLSLKEFKPRHTRRGVTYKISKKTGRQLAPGAFMGPRPGQKAARLRGHVWKRTGTHRKPIVLLKGASPWGVYVKKSLDTLTRSDAQAEFRKQLDRRIRFILLKKSGAI